MTPVRRRRHRRARHPGRALDRRRRAAPAAPSCCCRTRARSTSVDVRGAAPGTRETDLLSPDNTVQVAHAVLLSGGSAFGLAAADGVMQPARGARHRGAAPARRSCRSCRRRCSSTSGTATWRARPDAASGRRRDPGRRGRAGRAAPDRSGQVPGRRSASCSATRHRPGSARRRCALPGGATVGAVAAVNAVGDVVDEAGRLLAGPGTVEHLLTHGAAGSPGRRHQHHARPRRHRRAAHQDPGPPARGRGPRRARPGDPAGAHAVRRGHGVRGLAPGRPSRSTTWCCRPRRSRCSPRRSATPYDLP